jgi:redox-sensitive bicupin YhaK (pirin superfamily)
VQVNGDAVAREGQLLVMDREAGHVSLAANNDSAFLVLSGEPLNEPIVGLGPFVMNTEEEIEEAVKDFNAGRFGHIPPASGVPLGAAIPVSRN